MSLSQESNKNKKPFFSIVIPTRNRADTLQYTIKTVLQQSFEDYELIICDNNSCDDTKDVVDKYNSKKIHYFNTGEDLAMHDSWEFAISKARGEYVTIIADNDGFIEGSLEFLHNLLQFNNHPNILRWTKNLYNWASLESVNKNKMSLNSGSNLSVIDSKKMITKVLNGIEVFQELPMIYNSVINYKLVKKLKKKTGRVINALSPDIYTGIAFAYLNKNYLSLSMPITIGSNSAKSNGYNGLRKHKNKSFKEFKKLANRSKVNFHTQVPFVKTYVIAIADAFVKAKEFLNIDIYYDRNEMLKRAVKTAFIFDDKDLQESKKLILQSCKDDKKMFKYAKELIKNLNISTHTNELEVNTGFKNHKLILSANDYALENVYDVSKFMSKFYNYSLSNVNLPEVSKKLKEIPKDATIAIWGRGDSSHTLIRNIERYRKDIKIEYLIDSFYEDENSTPKIITPNSITNIKYIIIASMYVVAIKKTFDELNIKENISIFKFVK